tara:strand:+ start:24076 stop:24744 length:669 start_codon:yes stop_codon:yes gene_type:complete
MNPQKVEIKICGITSTKQALKIAEIGANAIGVIGVQESPRYVPEESQASIFQALSTNYPNLNRVLVLKDFPLSQLELFNQRYHPTTIQLHGDESTEYCIKAKNKLKGIQIWKAFRVKSSRDHKFIKTYLDYVDGIVLDSWDPNIYGGTGKRIKVEHIQGINLSKPLWIAGGISEKNVIDLIKDLRPYGIDASSKLEEDIGVKDLKKVSKLIEKVKLFNLSFG